MTGAPAGHNRTFLRRLLDARVIQTLAIYVPVAWVITEIVTAATANFGLPAWLPGLSMVLLISGIPVAAFLAWAFQITEDGIRTEVVSVKGGLVIAVALAALLGTGTALFQRLAPPESGVETVPPATAESVTSVSVLEFDVPEAFEQGRAFSSEISDRLARHADLIVTAPGSVYSARLASLMPSDQQEVLLTDYAVVGIIEEEGDAFRLHVALMDAEHENVWEADFPLGSDAESQRGVQRRVSRQLAQILGTRTPTAEYCEPSDNIEALESYHEARLLLDEKGPKNLAAAERLLKRAIELDPGYGRAYSALAITNVLQRKPGLAVDLSRKALDRCPTLGAAYKIWVPPYEGVNNFAVNQELQWLDALAMEPNHLWLLDNYAMWLEGLGRTDEALKIVERSYRNNPMSPRAVVSYGWSQSFAQRWEEARNLAHRARELGDESCNVDLLLLHIETKSGSSVDEILTAYESVAPRCRDEMLQGLQGFNAADLGAAFSDPAERRRLLDYMESNMESNPNLAMVLGIELGDPDLAHRAFEYAGQNGHFIHRPAFWMRLEGARLFRRDPRFAATMAEWGLDEYWREFGWPSGGMCAPLGEGIVCDN